MFRRLLGNTGILNNRINPHSLIVAFCSVDNSYFYSEFDNLNDFIRYVNRFDKWSAHEVIIEGKQKPHFDLDITDSTLKISKNILDDLINNIILILKHLNIEISPDDIIIFDSSDEHKYSYHIILNNYYHNNNIEARELFNLVVKHMNPKYIEYLDSGVYKRIQNFRLPGSYKISEGQYVRQKKFSSLNKIHVSSLLEELEIGLVNIFNVSGMIYIPIVIPPTIKKEIIVDFNTEKCLDLLRGIDTDEIFKYVETRDNIIILRRTKASKCIICDRIHTSENPFLMITDEGVYFNCRRSKHNMFLGSLIINDQKEEKHERRINITLLKEIAKNI